MLLQLEKFLKKQKMVDENIRHYEERNNLLIKTF